MQFKHEQVDHLGYDDLVAETSDKGRVYYDPEGKTYPSITTVLSILSEDSIREWRARVGEEEANKISTRAARRGTAVHSIIENYMNNEEDYKDGFTPDVVASFYSVRDILDSHVGKVYAMEAPLFSRHLGVAGRVDCVAEWDGKLSIIDFKTSRKWKKKEWIHNYFIQETAYAIMWEERTGMPITQLVTLIAGDEGPQVFVEHRDNWDKKLVETITEWRRRKLFGHV